MTIEVRVPTLGESVTEATIASWFKQPGEAVNVDEMLCELETDKVTIEVPAPVAGVLGDHGHTGACAPGLKLLDGSGTKRVSRGDHDLQAGTQQPLCQLADRRRFADAVDPYDHNDERTCVTRNEQRPGARLNDLEDALSELGVNRGPIGKLFAGDLPGDVSDQVLCGIDTDVGGQ